jgi:hypothetical protein
VIDGGYLVGQGVRFTVAWTADGAVTDVVEPVTLRVKHGDGVTIADHPMEPLGGGKYTTVVTFDAPGAWLLRAQTSGDAPGVVEDSVRIRASEFS